MWQTKKNRTDKQTQTNKWQQQQQQWHVRHTTKLLWILTSIIVTSILSLDDGRNVNVVSLNTTIDTRARFGFTLNYDIVKVSLSMIKQSMLKKIETFYKDCREKYSALWKQEFLISAERYKSDIHHTIRRNDQNLVRIHRKLLYGK